MNAGKKFINLSTTRKKFYAPAVVEDPLLCTALWRLFLLLLVNFWCL
jgi:hypothetical protein